MIRGVSVGAARKYGLPDPSPGMLTTNAPKAALSALVLHRAGLERYGGSAAGAWAALRGVSALAREGLVEEVSAAELAP